MSKTKYCKHFKQITSDDESMIFGCWCYKLDKPIFAYNCEGCKLKEFKGDKK